MSARQYHRGGRALGSPEGLSDLGGIRTMGAKSESGTLPPRCKHSVSAGNVPTLWFQRRMRLRRNTLRSVIQTVEKIPEPRPGLGDDRRGCDFHTGHTRPDAGHRHRDPMVAVRVDIIAPKLG